MSTEGGHDPLLPLLQGIAKGNHNLFRQLYDATNQRLTVYLRRMLTNQEGIEDISPRPTPKSGRMPPVSKNNH